MEKKYWLNKWESNDIGFHQENVNPNLISYFHLLNLQPEDGIFVPLCGKSKDMLWLAEQGHHVIGIELSSIACQDFFQEANINFQLSKQEKFTKYSHKKINLLCGDFFDLTEESLPEIKMVFDCKALIALPAEIRKNYAKHLISCLGSNVKILLVTLETNHENGPPFSVTFDEVATLYSPYSSIQQLKRSKQSNIPKHIIEQGYHTIVESVYLISEQCG